MRAHWALKGGGWGVKGHTGCSAFSHRKRSRADDVIKRHPWVWRSGGGNDVDQRVDQVPCTLPMLVRMLAKNGAEGTGWTRRYRAREACDGRHNTSLPTFSAQPSHDRARQGWEGPTLLLIRLMPSSSGATGYPKPGGRGKVGQRDRARSVEITKWIDEGVPEARTLTPHPWAPQFSPSSAGSRSPFHSSARPSSSRFLYLGRPALRRCAGRKGRAKRWLLG